MNVADTEILAAGTTVRARVVVDAPLGLGAGTVARTLASHLWEEAASRTSAWPVSSPEIQGGAFVLDLRVRDTVTGKQLREQLEAAMRDRFLGIFGAFSTGRVTDLERIGAANLKSDTGPVERAAAAEDAERARQARTVTVGSIAERLADGVRLVRGLLVVAIVGAFLYVGWPALRAGSGAVARRLKKAGG